MECHFLLQGIFLTQGSNPSLLCLLHCRQILYRLSHWGSLYFVFTVSILWMSKHPETPSAQGVCRSVCVWPSSITGRKEVGRTGNDDGVGRAEERRPGCLGIPTSQVDCLITRLLLFLSLFLRGSSPGPRDAASTAVGWETLGPPEPRGRPPGRRRGRHGSHQLHRGPEDSREYTTLLKGGICEQWPFPSPMHESEK